MDGDGAHSDRARQGKHGEGRFGLARRPAVPWRRCSVTMPGAGVGRRPGLWGFAFRLLFEKGVAARCAIRRSCVSDSGRFMRRLFSRCAGPSRGREGFARRRIHAPMVLVLTTATACVVTLPAVLSSSILTSSILSIFEARKQRCRGGAVHGATAWVTTARIAAARIAAAGVTTAWVTTARIAAAWIAAAGIARATRWR
jgi:hypothetical protein